MSDANFNKMDEVKRIAEQVIKKAYKNGGKVDYDEVKDLITCDFDSLDRVLTQYGKRSVRIGHEWYKFELNPQGFAFYENGCFDGIKRKSDQQEIITDLTEKNLKLQNDNLEYQKKIRWQESVIRNWKMAEIITAILALLGWSLLVFL